jgi:hypothetical protein
MNQMSVQLILAKCDGAEVRRISGRDVTDLYLGQLGKADMLLMLVTGGGSCHRTDHENRATGKKKSPRKTKHD